MLSFSAIGWMDWSGQNLMHHSIFGKVKVNLVHNIDSIYCQTMTLNWKVTGYYQITKKSLYF